MYHHRRRKNGHPPNMELKEEVVMKKKTPNKLFKNVVLTSGIGIIVIGMLIVQAHNADVNDVVNAESFLNRMKQMRRRHHQLLLQRTALIVCPFASNGTTRLQMSGGRIIPVTRSILKMIKDFASHLTQM